MSTDQRTHVPGDGPGTDNLPALRPVTITADPIEVRTRRPRLRTVTSGTPIAGGVTPAPAGQSKLDRAVRRLVIEVVRTGLWIVGVAVTVAVNLMLAVRWAVGRARLPRSRRRTEVDRLAVRCGSCGVVTSRQSDGSAPAGWFHQITRSHFLCPGCTRGEAAKTRAFWSGGEIR
ncbi:hypothetical protein E1262_27225 [Jiangella aurantiaca]|uniref:Uncharacterized protein n=1 Tax=Jiangella aurantiaca TaxID=2530373 RepID=A0A4R5A5F7_9ACTN|nr:hypothetical protein [Jiangella aurantiaca]TDD64782.1 hypothetical protein E1262_27225 [Jiangella aurantiaca]